MPLTAEQRKKATEFLQLKLRNPCAVCGAKQFTVADIVTATPYDSPGRLVIGGKMIPLVLVICDHCYHAIAFAAVPMGIVTADATPPEPPNEEPPHA